MNIRLAIDGHMVEVPSGATLLDAARALELRIPTLCYRDGLPHYTSCMVCTVRDLASDRLLPACSYPATDGMNIDASSADVRAARRRVLELLLSEHVGDCEAPCRRACPTRLRIPELLRNVAHGDWSSAARLAVDDLVLPASLGRICPAPCESNCRRALRDAPLAIRELHRCLGETRELANARTRVVGTLARPIRVVVVGAGPAGLAAAATLRRAGADVRLFDRAQQPGGALRSEPIADRLPASILDAEIEEILAMGIQFEGGADFCEPGVLDCWLRDCDALVLTCGPLAPSIVEPFGLCASARGIAIDPSSRQTSRQGIFAAGAAVAPTRLAVRAVADGRLAAESVLVWLEVRSSPPWPARFDSRIGRLEREEIESWMPDASSAPRTWPADALLASATLDESSSAEARRCLGCDCRKARSCRLRRLADEYGVTPTHFQATTRPPVIVRRDHPRLIYEPGKCIKCGICVHLALRANGTMTFQRRGYDSQIAPAFQDSLEAGLGNAAEAAVRACPTAALAFRTWEPMSGDYR